MSVEQDLIRQLVKTQQWLRIMHAVALALISARDGEMAIAQILAMVGQDLGWQAGGYWEPDAKGELLQYRSF